MPLLNSWDTLYRLFNQVQVLHLTPLSAVRQVVLSFVFFFVCMATPLLASLISSSDFLFISCTWGRRHHGTMAQWNRDVSPIQRAMWQPTDNTNSPTSFPQKHHLDQAHILLISYFQTLYTEFCSTWPWSPSKAGCVQTMAGLLASVLRPSVKLGSVPKGFGLTRHNVYEYILHKLDLNDVYRFSI